MSIIPKSRAQEIDRWTDETVKMTDGELADFLELHGYHHLAGQLKEADLAGDPRLPTLPGLLGAGGMRLRPLPGPGTHHPGDQGC